MAACSKREGAQREPEDQASTPLYVKFQIPALKVERKMVFLLRPSQSSSVVRELDSTIMGLKSRLGDSVIGGTSKLKMAAELVRMEQAVANSFEEWQSYVDEWKVSADARVRSLESQLDHAKAKLQSSERQARKIASELCEYGAPSDYSDFDTCDRQSTFLASDWSSTEMRTEYADFASQSSLSLGSGPKPQPSYRVDPSAFSSLCPGAQPLPQHGSGARESRGRRHSNLSLKWASVRASVKGAFRSKSAPKRCAVHPH